MIEHNELEHLLKAASIEPGRRPEFYRCLLDADVWVLVGGISRGGTVPAGEQIDLVQWQRDDGAWVVPFFSSVGMARQGAPFEINAVSMTGRELFVCMRGTPLALNPNCEIGREFAVSEVEALLEHGSLVPPDCEILQEDRGVYLEPVAEPPTMVESLSALYVTRGSVRAAYIVRARYASEPTRPILLVGIDADSADIAILQDTAAIVHESGCAVQSVDVMQLNPSDGAIGQQIAQMSTPFYQRLDIVHRNA